MRVRIIIGIVFVASMLTGFSLLAGTVPEESFGIKIGAPVLGGNIPFFNKTAGPGDLVVVRPQNLFLLQEITAGVKTVIVGLQDLGHARAILTQAKNQGATVAGLSLEGNPKLEIGQDILAKSIAFAKAAKKAGFAFVLIPRPGEQGFKLQPWLGLVDAVILPAQGVQAKDDFGQILGPIITRIKAAAPKAQVWVQVTANPPKDGTITPEFLLSKIAQISGLADGIFIGYGPKSWETARAVILKLKNLTD